jgi:hypothetical protein
MVMVITFPWPFPSANIALTGLAALTNRVRVPDRQARDLEPVGAAHGAYRANDASNR